MNIRNWLIERGLIGSAPEIPVSDELRSYLLTGVDQWKNIYCGGGDWRYARKGGLDGGYRRVRSLGAAKALCAELAALCFSQQADILCGDEKTTQYVMTVLQENGFWSCFPLFLEKMFAIGSGVVKTYCENGAVKLDYIGGDCFIPTQFDEKGVYGGIAVSCVYDGKEQYVLLENHRRTPDGYVITNTLFRRRDASFVREELSVLYPGLQEETTVSGLKNPLFVYFRPSSAVGDIPLGCSVYASAVDTLESLDIVFDSLQREFVLGKKRIIVPVSALRGEYGRDGKLHKYFDEQDEVFQAFSADDKEELKITDNSTELRVGEHSAAVEQLLDLLCMQTGLSAGSLSYHGSTAKTATEVVSRSDKTFRTRTAHQQLLREGLISLVNNIVLLGVLCGKLETNALNAQPQITFPDSVSRDNSERIDNTLKLYSAGLINKPRAMAEIYGLTVDEAEEAGKEVVPLS